MNYNMEKYLELPINILEDTEKEISLYVTESGSFFVKCFCEELDYKPEEVAYTAIYYSDLYDLYFTKIGWFGDFDYIITKKGNPRKKIYRELYPFDYETLIGYKEFLYTTFRVDEEAEIEERAISSEEHLPSNIIINGFKYSDKLNNRREEYTTVYTTLQGQKIDFTDLNDVRNDITSVYQLPLITNEEFTDCVQTLIDRFGITEEEGEDIMINYYDIPRPDKSNLTESNKLKQKYIYAGPIYRFKKLYKDYWEDYTYAISPKQALNNLTYKAKINNGYVKDTNLTLDINYLLCDDNFIDDTTGESKDKYCDRCGKKLNDRGTCPICDDGEEDY